MHLDGFFFNGLVAEIEKEMVGSRVEDVYDGPERELIFRLRNPGKTLLFCIPLPVSAFYLRTDRVTKPAIASGLSQTLKKHLASFFCLSVTNIPFDRRGTIGFGPEPNGEASYYLHIEIMGRQRDLFFCTGEQIVAGTRSPKSASNRLLQPGDRYIPPPVAAKASPCSLSGSMLKLLCGGLHQLSCEDALTRVVFGIGPLLAREICSRVKVAGLKIGALGDNAFMALAQEISRLGQASINNQSQPVVYDLEGPYWIQLKHLTSSYKCYETFASAITDWHVNFRSGKEFNLLFQRLKSALSSAQAKLSKTLTKQEAELERAGEFETFRQIADTLLANIDNVPTRASQVTLANVHTGDPFVIKLNPNLSASANALRYYKYYKKYKNAVFKVEEQLQQNRYRQTYLNVLAYDLATGASLSEIRELASTMEAAGLIRNLTPARRSSPPQDSWLSLRSSQGTVITVGKNNRQNEMLTFQIAAKNHYWFHCRNSPGSHVILGTDNPNDDEIAYAAAIAAWYSNERSAPKVEVVWTLVKNVKKIAGAPPGLVKYTDYRSLFIIPSPG